LPEHDGPGGWEDFVVKDFSADIRAFGDGLHYALNAPSAKDSRSLQRTPMRTNSRLQKSTAFSCAQKPPSGAPALHRHVDAPLDVQELTALWFLCESWDAE
jgi:hypothetical protein